MRCKCILGFFTIIGALSLSSCNENLTQEIEELHLDRALSPTQLTAQVVDRTNVRLNWRTSSNAESYIIEFYDNQEFVGQAERVIDGVTSDQLPITIEGLFGETKYGVRVGAVGEGLGNSTWITDTLTTGIENIFNELDPETLTEESVTLSWPEGEPVTAVVLMPGGIQHEVTSADVTAGRTTITGLESDVIYTATLMNEDKRRGVLDFTTLLGGPGVTKVAAGADLAAVVAAAADGAILAIDPGTYTVNGNITVNKNIAIRGYKPHDRPVINGAIIRVENNAGLIMKDLVLDAAGATSDQTVVYNEDNLDVPYGDFSMENCEIRNYVKGIMYANTKVRIPLVTFRNNLIHDIECNGGDFIDFRNGIADVFEFVDNTVYNSALQRDLFRMDAGGSNNFPGVSSQIAISQNTFYRVVDNSGRRYLYVRLANHSISFTKNIIVESQGIYTNQSATTITEMSGNNYYEAPNFTTSGSFIDTGNYTEDNPEFTNPDEGNFTLNNLDLILNGIGASRWRVQ